MRLAIVLGAMLLGLIGELFDVGGPTPGGATTSGAVSQEQGVHATDDNYPPPPTWP